MNTRLALRLLVLAISPFLAFAALEASMRVCTCVRIGGLGIPNLAGLHPFNDNASQSFRFSNNEWGFRDRPRTLEKARGTKRIVVLGDSHTFGIGVDDAQRFSNLAEAALNSAAAPTEVVNLAFYPQSENDYAADIERTLSFHPDVVVMVVYTGNDLVELLGRPSSPRWPPGGGPIGRIFRGYQTYQLAKYWTQPDGSTGPMGEPPCRAGYDPLTFGAFHQQGEESCLIIRQPDIAEPSFVAYRAHTDAVLSRLQQSSVRLIAMLLPSQLVADPSRGRIAMLPLAGAMQLDPADLEATALRLHQRMVADFPAGATVVDLLPAFREAAVQGPLFLPHDWHLNPAGHAVVARELIRLLRTP